MFPNHEESLPDHKRFFTGRKIWDDIPDTKGGIVNPFEYCRRFFRKSQTERKRFFEVARSSVIKMDTALDIACELQFKPNEDLHSVGLHLVGTFKPLCGLIG